VLLCWGRAGVSDMTLWHLLSMTAFVAPLISSLQTARAAQASIGGYALSFLAGALLGILWSGVLWLAIRRVAATLSLRSALPQVVVAISTSSTSIAWIVLGGVYGDHAALVIMRLLELDRAVVAPSKVGCSTVLPNGKTVTLPPRGKLFGSGFTSTLSGARILPRPKQCVSRA
jgi:hypothetical protein